PSQIYTLSLHDALPISVVATLNHMLGTAWQIESGQASHDHLSIRIEPRLSYGQHYFNGSDPFDPTPLIRVAAFYLGPSIRFPLRSEEHTSELQSRENLV